ncbi:MAG: hypothetical protein DIU52_015085 [bacterium]
MRRTPIHLAAAAVALLAAGCSRNPPPRLPGAGLDCPPPMLWRAGEPRPWLVRVVNHGADSIVVFLEGCLEVRRVGDVGPGKTRLFPLPQGLIVYEDGLRMHVVRGAGTSQPDVVVMPIPVDTARVLQLEVPEEHPPCPAEVFVDGKPPKGDTLPAIGAGIVRMEYYHPWARPPGMEGECAAINLVTRRQRPD